MWFRKRKKPDSAAMSRELREKALSLSASELGLKPDGSRVWGLLMETGYPEAVATLAAFADGSTSLYFSSGGGTIGAGEHASVAGASENLLGVADEYLHEFTPASEYPLPAVGRVRFYVHTFDGILTADRNEDDLGFERDSLAPVFHAGHAVISAIRELEGS